MLTNTEVDLHTCKGGPNKICGDRVKDGEDAVQCDKCQVWYHAGCQGVAKLALKAIDKHHPLLLWLCHTCKVWLQSKDQNPTNAEYVNLDGPNATENKAVGPHGSTHHTLEQMIGQLQQSMESRMQCLEQILQNQAATLGDQSRLIEKGVKDQTELKTTYADIVRENSIKMVETATKKDQLSNKDACTISGVFDEFLDKEKRKCNIVVHNLPEQSGPTGDDRSQADSALFVSMVREVFRINARVTRSFRAGRIVSTRQRLLIVTLDSEQTKHDLLKVAPQLRSSLKWGDIYLSPDLTWKERQENRALREELKRRREAGESELIIHRKKIVPRKGPRLQSTYSKDQAVSGPSHQGQTSHPIGSNSPTPTTASIATEPARDRDTVQVRANQTLPAAESTTASTSNEPTQPGDTHLVTNPEVSQHNVTTSTTDQPRIAHQAAPVQRTN